MSEVTWEDSRKGRARKEGTECIKGEKNDQKRRESAERNQSLKCASIKILSKSSMTYEDKMSGSSRLASIRKIYELMGLWLLRLDLWEIKLEEIIEERKEIERRKESGLQRTFSCQRDRELRQRPWMNCIGLRLKLSSSVEGVSARRSCSLLDLEWPVGDIVLPMTLPESLFWIHLNFMLWCIRSK